MTVTTMDPRSALFLSKLPPEIVLNKDTTIDRMIRLADSMSTNFDYLFPKRDIKGVAPLSPSIIKTLSVNETSNIISSSYLARCIDFDVYNNTPLDSLKAFEETVSTLDQMCTRDSSIDVPSDFFGIGRLENIFGKSQYKLSATITPINKFVAIPGKVICYTFIFRRVRRRNVDNALVDDSVEEGSLLIPNLAVYKSGVCLNFWVSLINFQTISPSLNYSKFKGDGIIYEYVKHHLAYKGFHLYPDGSICAKININNKTSLVPVSPTAHKELCADIVGIMHGYWEINKLFKFLVERSSFTRKIFNISPDNCQGSYSAYGSAPKIDYPPDTPDVLKSFYTWWNCNREGSVWHTNSHEVSLSLSSDCSDEVSMFVRDYIDNKAEEALEDEVFEEHPELLTKLPVDKSTFDSASRRSRAGFHFVDLI